MKTYEIYYKTAWMKTRSHYTTVQAETPAKAKMGFDLSIPEILRLRADKWSKAFRQSEEFKNPAKGLRIFAKGYMPTISDIVT